MTAPTLVPLAVASRPGETARLALWEELDRALAQRTDTAARAARRLRHRLARLAPVAGTPAASRGDA